VFSNNKTVASMGAVDPVSLHLSAAKVIMDGYTSKNIRPATGCR